jgi:hypothetical protein
MKEVANPAAKEPKRTITHLTISVRDRVRSGFDFPRRSP